MINILLVGNIINDSALQLFYDHLYRWGVAALSDEEFNFRFLTREKAYNENSKNHLIDKLNPVCISASEINAIFRAGYPNHVLEKKLKDNDVDVFSKMRFFDVLSRKLKNFIPDIIIFMAGGIEFFHEKYPKSLCFTTDNSIFARPPFPRCVVYDPYPYCHGSFLNKYAEFIKIKEISSGEKKRIQFFKDSIASLNNKNDDIAKLIENFKKLFRKACLLPLAGKFSNVMGVYDNKEYKSDYDIVEYVMQNMPNDIGVFVTDHDLLGTLNYQDIEYFRNKYSNFIYIDTKFNGVHSASLDYYPHVDAVLNTCSKTGLTACLWDKPIVSLSDKWNDFTKDFDFSAENIVKAVNMGKSVKDNILFFYLMNYVILPSDYNSSEKMKAFFINKLNKFRNEGITENFFEQIHNPEEAYREILMRTEENLIKAKQAKEASERKVLIDNITSQKMENERLAAEVEKLQRKIVESHKFDNLRIRLLSHITFGKTKQYYQKKWREIKKVLKK